MYNQADPKLVARLKRIAPKLKTPSEALDYLLSICDLYFNNHSEVRKLGVCVAVDNYKSMGDHTLSNPRFLWSTILDNGFGSGGVPWAGSGYYQENTHLPLLYWPISRQPKQTARFNEAQWIEAIQNTSTNKDPRYQRVNCDLSNIDLNKKINFINIKVSEPKNIADYFPINKFIFDVMDETGKSENSNWGHIKNKDDNRQRFYSAWEYQNLKSISKPQNIGKVKKRTI